MKGMDIKYGRVRAACLFSLRSKSPVSSSIKFSHLNNSRTQKATWHHFVMLFLFLQFLSSAKYPVTVWFTPLIQLDRLIWSDRWSFESFQWFFFLSARWMKLDHPRVFFFFSPAAGSMGKTVCYWFRYIPNSCLHPVDRTFQISRLINPRDFRVTPWRHAIHTQGQSWALCGLLYNTIIQQIRIHKPHSQFQKLQLIFLIIVFWCHAKDCIRIYEKGDGSSQRGF